eukprot:816648-Rhodomonas_salina.3
MPGTHRMCGTARMGVRGSVVLLRRRRPISLCVCYAMSGTDLGYGTTRWLLAAGFFSDPSHRVKFVHRREERLVQNKRDHECGCLYWNESWTRPAYTCMMCDADKVRRNRRVLSGRRLLWSRVRHTKAGKVIARQACYAISGADLAHACRTQNRHGTIPKIQLQDVSVTSSVLTRGMFRLDVPSKL